jgi:antitoxin component YwqK of YwqJK toxin-antitoxin module
MKVISFLTGIFIYIFLLYSCKGKAIEINYYSRNQIKDLTIYKKDSGGQKVVYSFYENGEIEEIHRYNRQGEYTGEQQWFYPDGFLDRKIPKSNGKANGNGYYFYDSTGTLSAHRYFRNDKEVFHGAEYWEDSIGITKSSIYFNDSGHIYYKKNFDKNGNLINEEGKRKNR